MGGLKDFAITQYMTEISSVKVVTLTLGHPVYPSPVALLIHLVQDRLNQKGTCCVARQES